MIFVILVGTLMAGYGTAYVASEDVRYLTRAGIEETRILESRRPIAKLVKDRHTSPQLRTALRLVIASRDYADSIGLEARKTYTTYADVGRDTLLLVLSVSPRNCLCPYTWHYPIVGHIPYKGFFDPKMAQRTASKFEGQGYDTYLRPSSAFSTLGWFNDPLLSTAVGPDSVELTSLVLHEIAHNTLYVKSATPFNESFAQLVGYRATEAFFRERGDTALARKAGARWEDEIVLSGYYAGLNQRLDSLYALTKDSVAVDGGRAEIARWARIELQDSVSPRLKTYQIGHLSDRPINNARLIAARIYRMHLDLFERFYEQHDRKVPQTVAALRVLMKGVEGDSAAYAVLSGAVER